MCIYIYTYIHIHRDRERGTCQDTPTNIFNHLCTHMYTLHRINIIFVVSFLHLCFPVGRGLPKVICAELRGWMGYRFRSPLVTPLLKSNKGMAIGKTPNNVIMSSSIVWITFYLSQDPNIHITSRLANMDMETTWLPWKWSNFQWNFHMSMWVYSRVNFMQSLRFRHRETAIMKPPSPRLGQVPGHGKSMPHGPGEWPHFYGTSPGENHGNQWQSH